MRRFFLLSLLAVCWGRWCSAADTEMPVIAFNGVPAAQMSDAHFRTFSECGFSVSLSAYPSLDLLVKACR